MTESDLHHLVASVTGDDLCAIVRLGFQLADPDEVDFDPEPSSLAPQMIDWDEVDRQRNWLGS